MVNYKSSDAQIAKANALEKNADYRHKSLKVREEREERLKRQVFVRLPPELSFEEDDLQQYLKKLHLAGISGKYKPDEIELCIKMAQLYYKNVQEEVKTDLANLIVQMPTNKRDKVVKSENNNKTPTRISK